MEDRNAGSLAALGVKPPPISVKVRQIFCVAQNRIGEDRIRLIDRLPNDDPQNPISKFVSANSKLYGSICARFWEFRDLLRLLVRGFRRALSTDRARPAWAICNRSAMTLVFTLVFGNLPDFHRRFAAILFYLCSLLT